MHYMPVNLQDICHSLLPCPFLPVTMRWRSWWRRVRWPSTWPPAWPSCPRTWTSEPAVQGLGTCELSPSRHLAWQGHAAPCTFSFRLRLAFCRCAKLLTQFTSLHLSFHRMCGSLGLRFARTESSIQRRIAALILLHEALAVLPPLAEALQGARCQLLQVLEGGGKACCLVTSSSVKRSRSAGEGRHVRTPAMCPLTLLVCRRWARRAGTQHLASCGSCCRARWRRMCSPTRTPSSTGGGSVMGQRVCLRADTEAEALETEFELCLSRWTCRPVQTLAALAQYLPTGRSSALP